MKNVCKYNKQTIKQRKKTVPGDEARVCVCACDCFFLDSFCFFLWCEIQLGFCFVVEREEEGRELQSSNPLVPLSAPLSLPHFFQSLFDSLCFFPFLFSFLMFLYLSFPSSSSPSSSSSSSSPSSSLSRCAVTFFGCACGYKHGYVVSFRFSWVFHFV